MTAKNKGIPSPFPMHNPAAQLRAKLIEYLDLLRMPILRQHVTDKCTQACHIIEHNHTIDALRHFLDNVQI